MLELGYFIFFVRDKNFLILFLVLKKSTNKVLILRITYFFEWFTKNSEGSSYYADF